MSDNLRFHLESRSRFTRIAVLTGAALLTLAAGLIVLEILFGRWFSQDPWADTVALNLIRDRTVYYDVHQFYASSRTAVRYTRDQYGLRGTHRSAEDIELLTVGGSTTDQHYVDDEETWQHILQERLQTRFRQSYAVANAGVSGHSTHAHLASFERWFPLIPRLAPRYILFYVGINDVFVGENSPFDNATAASTDLIGTLKHSSALYRLYTLWHGTIRALEAGLVKSEQLTAVVWTTVPLRSAAAEFYSTSAARFGDRINRLLDQARAMGARPICVTQPVRYFRSGRDRRIEGTAEIFESPEGPMNGVDYYHKKQALDRELIRRCRDAGAIAVDLAAQEWEDEDFYDYVHMVPRGTRKVGERLAEALGSRLHAGELQAAN